MGALYPAIDATAGLGEDSILLAAYGYNVELYEKNPIISELLKDAMERASRISQVTKCNLKKLRNLSTGKFNILDGSNTASDGEHWSDGENKYKKRYRVIVNVTYDKE